MAGIELPGLGRPAVLVRKLTRAKWEPADWLSARGGGVPADALSADLRTTGCTLSWWGAGPEPGSRDKVALALAAGQERLDKLDLVWVPLQGLERAGLELEGTPGKTPARGLVGLHVNMVHLDGVQLLQVAELIRANLKAAHFRRYSRREVEALLREAVRADRLALDECSGSLREELSQKP